MASPAARGFDIIETYRKEFTSILSFKAFLVNININSLDMYTEKPMEIRISDQYLHIVFAAMSPQKLHSPIYRKCEIDWRVVECRSQKVLSQCQ